MSRTEQARAYARRMRGRFLEVCRKTGVTYHWLSKFAQGRIAHPAGDRIDALLAYRDRTKTRRP